MAYYHPTTSERVLLKKLPLPEPRFRTFMPWLMVMLQVAPVNNQLCHERSFVFCFCFISNGLTYFVFRLLTGQDQVFHRRHHTPRGNVHTPDLALRARCSEGGGLSLDLSGKRPTAIMRRPVRHERMIPDFRGPCLRFVFGSMGPLVSYLEENKTSLPSSCFCNETDNGRYGKCRKRCRLSAHRHASWSVGAGELTRTIVRVPLPPPPLFSVGTPSFPSPSPSR